MSSDPLNWQALEYPEKDRSADWFFAVGIIAASIAVGAFIFGNTLFGILIVVATTSLFVQVRKKPRMIEYQINNRGVKVGTYLYPYQTLESFGIDDDGRPILMLKSTRSFMPLIELPLGDMDTEAVRTCLTNHLPEELLRQSVFQKILDYLGF